MSFVYIKLNGTLSDALYQSCTAYAASTLIDKKLVVSPDNLDSYNVPMFNKIKQFSSLNCSNCFYEQNMTSDDIGPQIRLTRKNIEFIGKFKNKKHFMNINRDILYWEYNFKIDSSLEKSSYVYINDSFFTNERIFTDVIDNLVNKNDTQTQVVIDSKKYANIYKKINKRYLEFSNITIADDINDYEKLSLMVSCKKGGYYIGDELGWWSYYFNRTENESIQLEVKTYEKLNLYGKVFIVLPVYDDINKCFNVIEQIMDQSYPFFKLFIMDNSLLDNSNNLGKILDEWGTDRIQYCKIEAGMQLGGMINHAISQYLLTDYWYFTCIQHTNTYFRDYIKNLIKLQGDFMYTGHSLRKNNNNIDVMFDDVKIHDLNKCDQIRSCIWSRRAIENIPGYFSNLGNNTEIFLDYILKTFRTLDADRIKYNNVINMEYLDNGESANRVYKFYQNITVDKPLFLYYSKTPYKLLFQRPQQITRFIDHEYTKVFICKEENMLEYEDKYNMFVISYDYKKVVFDMLKNCDTVIYYTDNRLLDEVLSIKGTGTIKIMYDLIDNPSEEFSVWKPNLERAIHLSDFVTYSHPKLLNTLLEVYSSKKYHYISNACDYEHFSKAKERIGQRPAEYGETNKKILGYYGAFAEWLDYDVIRHYANTGEYHIIMIGGITNCASYNIRFEHPNITWLDHKPYDELPYYLSWFDVCFLPFRDCDFIKYVNPCKLWEYMASGKEIIKTGIDIECDKLITYTDVCQTIYNIITFGANDQRVINGIMNYNVQNEMDYENNSILFNSINSAVNNKTLNFSKPVIIVFSMIDYFFRIQRTQHLAHLCAKNGYTVFYLKTRINVDSDHNWATELVPNLYEINLACPTNRKLSVYGSVLTNTEIDLLVDSINNIRRRYNFQHFISFIANPFWLQVTRKINNTSIIYDCLDNTKEFKTHGDYILSLEHDAITSEYVTYTTPILKEVMDCNSKNYSIIRNGTEFDYFNSIQTIKLKRKARPIVGYYGAISDWWDVELVENMISTFPNLDFHFIGNIAGNNEAYMARIRNLSNYSNVTFFGEIPYDKLGDYLQKFNVGIIPFVLNDLIKCTNPVKMYEMFSFGIPVVMTELLDVVRLNVNDICYISKDKDDFIKNIETALNENDPVKKDKRIEYGRNNSWQNRFEQFQEIITKVAPPVSIVLLCYNNWNVTKRCIESVLQNSNYPYYEIIVVNNNSRDETRRELNKLYKDRDNIKIVHNKVNYGFATGMNIGALYAKYDYIVLLNNDTVVIKDWLYPLVKPLILKDYSMGSPITNNCGNGVKQFIHFNGVDDLMVKASKLQKMNNYKICEIDRIPFFCPILRKEDFYRVGLLDINYKIGGWEDDDLIHKIKVHSGLPNYYTFGSFVYHMESLTMSQMHNNNTNWSSQTRNKDYYESKWNTRWLSNTYKIPVLNNTMMSWRVCEFFIGILTRAKQALGTHVDYVDNKMNIIIKDTCEDNIEFNEIYIKKLDYSNVLLKNKYESIEINCGDLSWNESIRLLSFINTTLIMTE